VQLRMVLPTVLFLIISFKAIAAEKVLCDVTSDIDSDTGKIVYEMDEEDRAIKHLYQDSFRNGVRVARIELQADGLREGIVLNRKDKYITVRMQSDNFDTERGGILYLDTLYSGVSGERREYEMEMAMDKSGPILLKNNQKFSKMKFIAKRSRVFGVIGIEKVLFGN